MSRNTALLVSWGRGNGHVTRLLTIGDALASQGSECFALTHADPTHVELISRTSYGTISYPAWAEDADPWTQWSDPTFLGRSVEHDLALLQKIDPKLVVNDNRVSMAIACEITGTPIVTLCQDNQVPGFKYPGEEIAPIWTDAVDPVNQILEGHGVRPIADDLRWLFARGRIAIPNSAEHEPVMAPSEGMDIVHLGALLPLSSSVVDQPCDLLFYRTVDEVGEEFCQTFADWQGTIYIATGDAARAESLSAREMPQNIRVAALWNLSDLAPSLRAVVHHGGHGISTTCLSAGIPSVILPGPNPERQANGRRAANLNLGRVLVPASVSGPKWGPAVDITRDRPKWTDVASALANMNRHEVETSARTPNLLRSRLIEALS